MSVTIPIRSNPFLPLTSRAWVGRVPVPASMIEDFPAELSVLRGTPQKPLHWHGGRLCDVAIEHEWHERSGVPVVLRGQRFAAVFPRVDLTSGISLGRVGAATDYSGPSHGKDFLMDVPAEFSFEQMLAAESAPNAAEYRTKWEDMIARGGTADPVARLLKVTEVDRESATAPYSLSEVRTTLGSELVDGVSRIVQGSKSYSIGLANLVGIKRSTDPEDHKRDPYTNFARFLSGALFMVTKDQLSTEYKNLPRHEILDLFGRLKNLEDDFIEYVQNYVSPGNRSSSAIKDMCKRYEHIKKRFTYHGYTDLAAWIDGRIKEIQAF